MTLTHARTKTPKYPKVNMPSFFLFKAFVKTSRSLPKLAGSFLSFKSFCLHVSRTQTVPTWYASQAAAQLVAAPRERATHRGAEPPDAVLSPPRG